MPKKMTVTHHAQQRIREGDQRGPRTALSVAELVELANSPFAVKDGRYRYFYSPADRKTLTAVTAGAGRRIVTVHDTEHLPHRLADMLARKRAGAPFTFTESPVVAELDENDTTELTLGTFREHKRGDLRVYDLAEIGNFYLLNPRHPETVETEAFHQLVVDGTCRAWHEGRLSRSALRRLHTFLYVPEGSFGKLPTWISFELLGEGYPD